MWDDVRKAKQESKNIDYSDVRKHKYDDFYMKKSPEKQSEERK